MAGRVLCYHAFPGASNSLACYAVCMRCSSCCLCCPFDFWENEVCARCAAHDIIPGGVSASCLKNMIGMHMPESSLRLLLSALSASDSWHLMPKMYIEKVRGLNLYNPGNPSLQTTCDYDEVVPLKAADPRRFCCSVTRNDVALTCV